MDISFTEVKDKKLELKYVPNKGAWTYYIKIPDTEHIKGRWGFLKASGTILSYHYQLIAKSLNCLIYKNWKVIISTGIM